MTSSSLSKRHPQPASCPTRDSSRLNIFSGRSVVEVLPRPWVLCNVEDMTLWPKKFFILIAVFVCISPTATTAYCSERYFIDNREILLYKSINWWYTCLPRDDTLLCEKRIKCVNSGNTRINYNPSGKTIEFTIDRGFATLLSVFESRDADGTAPVSFRCSWQNEKYLGKGRARPVTNVNHFVFSQVGKARFQVLKRMEKKIEITIEGEILGLLENGRIALHRTGNLLKQCPSRPDGDGFFRPVRIRITNRETGEPIARYRIGNSSSPR